MDVSRVNESARELERLLAEWLREQKIYYTAAGETVDWPPARERETKGVNDG